MNVGSVVVGGLVDDDLIAVPKPAIAVVEIKWGDAEIESPEPEAARTASGETPDVSATETIGKVSVLPRMIEVEAGVVASLIVPDPFAIVMDVRGFGMALAITVGGLGSALARRFVGVPS